MRGFGLPGRRTALVERHVGAADAVAVLIALAAPLAALAVRAAGLGLVGR
jgi:hypothetical protein